MPKRYDNVITCTDAREKAAFIKWLNESHFKHEVVAPLMVRVYDLSEIKAGIVRGFLAGFRAAK